MKKGIFEFLSIAFITYLAYCFISLEINFTNWVRETRASFIVTTFVIWCMYKLCK